MKTISKIMLTLLLMSTLTLAFSIQYAKAEPTTWYVDDDGGADFEKIQDAIDAANPGDTIYVYNGVYKERIAITFKSLTLIGEDKNATVIDGFGGGPVVRISGSHVNFTGFTVQNAGWREWVDMAVSLYRASLCSISDTKVLNSRYGISVASPSMSNIISGNMISGTEIGIVNYISRLSDNNTVISNSISNSSTGIYFNYPYNIQIVGNTISNMTGEVRYGIHFEMGGSNNTVIGNTVIGYCDYGIAIRHADKNLVGRNTLSNNFYGIDLSQSSCDNTITENYASNNGVGISMFDNSNNNLIAMNDFSDSIPVDFYISDIGIWIDSSHDNTIHYNNITNNGNGVYLYSSSNNSISNSNITDNYTGIHHIYSSSNDIFGNNIANNIGGIALVYSSSNIFRNNVTNNDNGVRLQSSSSNIILGNNIKANNWYGVNLWNSSYNTFSGNNIANNGNGIWLDWSSNNTFDDNNIEGNQEYGIWLALSSDNNTLTYNNITANNWAGIGFYQSYDNNIYHNNFISNLQQVYDLAWYLTGVLPSINVWDDGYPSGGNYWSDYAGVDEKRGPKQNQQGSDGIGDTPYVIGEKNQDNYPLMMPWTLGPMESIQELIEIIKTWNLPKGTENSLTSKLDDAIHLLTRGNENGAMHKLTDFINQVKALRGKKLTSEQADYLILEAQIIIDLIQGQSP